VGGIAAASPKNVEEIQEHNAREFAREEARMASYRCIAKKCDGRQCTRRKTNGKEYCGRHLRAAKRVLAIWSKRTKAQHDNWWSNALHQGWISEDGTLILSYEQV